MDETWEEIAKSAAKEIRIDPISVEYIEARGFLCHELLYLLGGRIEFIFPPWWRLFSRLGDILFGVFPICRWYPPECSILEWVGHNRQYENEKVYRLIITQDDQVVFGVKYRPEPPANLYGMFFPYNVPQLCDFLRPPFEKYHELISKNLQDSICRHEQCIEPLAAEKEIYAGSPNYEINKGFWERFIQITPRKPKDEQNNK